MTDNNSFVPQWLARLDKVGGDVVDIEIEGDFAYVLDRQLGPQKIDISDPLNSDFIAYDNISDRRSFSRISNPTPRDLEVENDFIYVTYANSLWKYSTDNRDRALIFIDQYPISGGSIRVEGSDIVNDYAYVTGYRFYDGDDTRDSYLSIVDVNSGEVLGIQFITHETGRVTFNDVDVIGNRAYVAGGLGGLYIFDVSNPNVPTLINNVDLPNEFDSAEHIEIVGNLIYIANNNQTNYQSLEIIDISDLNNPNFLGGYDFELNEPLDDIKVSGDYAYIASDNGGTNRRTEQSSLSIVNISDPTNPHLQGKYRTLASSTNGEVTLEVEPIEQIPENESRVYQPTNTLAIFDNYLFTGGSATTSIIDISGLDPEPAITEQPSDSLLNRSFNRFRNKFVSGTYLFANQAESENIIANFGDVFELEGEAFNVSEQPADGLVKFNRFANLQVSGTYLFATEAESVSIRQNFSNIFQEEGTAFYAYGAEANQGTDYYRLANLQVQGTYLFVSQQERDSALAQFPNLFRDEGVAFEVN